MSTPNRYQPGAWKPQWKVDRIRWRLRRGLGPWGGVPRDVPLIRLTHGELADMTITRIRS